MKKSFSLVFLIAAALLQYIPPSLSETPESYGEMLDKQFMLGWVLAECQAYRDSLIPASRLSNTFTRIGLDREISDVSKAEIFQTVQEFPECAEVFSQWAK